MGHTGQIGHIGQMSFSIALCTDRINIPKHQSEINIKLFIEQNKFFNLPYPSEILNAIESAASTSCAPKVFFSNIPILLRCSKQFLRSPLQPCILPNPQDVKFYSWSFCSTYLTYMTALTPHSSNLQDVSLYS